MDKSESGHIKGQIAGLCFAILDVIQRLEIILYFPIIRKWLFRLFNTHDGMSDPIWHKCVHCYLKGSTDNAQRETTALTLTSISLVSLSFATLSASYCLCHLTICLNFCHYISLFLRLYKRWYFIISRINWLWHWI